MIYPFPVLFSKENFLPRNNFRRNFLPRNSHTESSILEGLTLHRSINNNEFSPLRHQLQILICFSTSIILKLIMFTKILSR